MKKLDFVEDNHIHLLCNGDEYFPRLEAAIDGAHVEIHLETYIFEYDAVGRRIAEALMRAVQRGVSVYLLLDGFGSQNLSQQIIHNLLNSGIKVLIFRPEFIFSMPRRHRLRRMHRKGPLLATIHKAAKHLWMIVAWAHLKKRWTNRTNIKPTEKPAGDQKAALVIRDNWRHRHDIEHAYLDAINQAKSEIIIANAYFLPGRKFNHALKNAARRGVRVELLLQGRIEYFLQHHATQALYENLSKAGVIIYEYNRSYLHAKVAVIDQYWATVGSSNIDPFSLLLAREANVIIEDHRFAHQLRASLKTAIAQESTPVTAASKHIYSWHSYILNWFSFYIVRIMQGLLGYE